MFDQVTDPKLQIELLRIATMREAERLSGMSEDTLESQFSDKIIRLSKRCRGMRVGDALFLARTATQSAA
jgi:hypothetical protein